MAEQRRMTLDEAAALLDKYDDDTESKATDDKRKAKVKDLLVEGAKQGWGGLNKNTRRLLDAIED